MERGAVADLVDRARDGDEDAWDGLVERYLGTVHAVCRAYRLADAEAAEVNLVVWLRLAEQLLLRHPVLLLHQRGRHLDRVCFDQLRDERLGDHVVSRLFESLAEVLADRLLQRGQVVELAEIFCELIVERGQYARLQVA